MRDFLLVINSQAWSYLVLFLRYGDLLAENAYFPTTLSFNAFARGEPFRIFGWTLSIVQEYVFYVFFQNP